MTADESRVRWGRWRVRLTVPGMAVAAATALLGPPAMESRDRLPVGILAAVVAVLVLNGVWARGRVVQTIDVSTPALAWSGAPIEITVELAGDSSAQHEVALVAVNGIFAVATRPRDRARLNVPALPTGIYDDVVVEATTAEPFGLVAVGRRAVVRLRRPLAVCPPPQRVDADAWNAATAGAQTENDEIVGLRERRSGDQLRDLDWAAMARTGRLIVRQRDRHSHGAVHLVVESETASLRELNTTLHRAHGLGRHLLAHGREVSLTMRDGRPERRAAPAATAHPEHSAAPATTADPDRSLTGQFSHRGQTKTHAVATPEHLAMLLAAAVPGPVRRPDGPHVLCGPDEVVPA